MTLRLALLSVVVVLGGCANGALRPSSSSSAPVLIRFKGEAGKVYETKYFSTSRILTYSESQLIKDRTESVEFTVRNEVQGQDAKTGLIRFTNVTTDKDGVVPLHDLAFPEKGEAIEYVVRPTGEVLKAGDRPAHSIFFSPAMPIPKDPVQVGDTWPMEFTWASARDGIPLKLEVVGILKNVLTCNGTHRCADVEISGKVNLVVTPDAKAARFQSRIWGRMLFDLDRGDVVWAFTRSREEMVANTERVSVSSCMMSETKGLQGYRTKLECEPKEEAITSVPPM